MVEQNVERPSMKEMEVSLGVLKNGKLSGSVDLISEYLKNGGKQLIKRHELH